MSSPVGDDLDLERLDTLVEEIGDRGLVRLAARTFLDELPDRLLGIRVAVHSGDRDSARAAAHALGSPAAMLGVTGVATSTRAMQDAIKSDPAVELAPLLAEIEASSARCGDALRGYLAEAPAD